MRLPSALTTLATALTIPVNIYITREQQIVAKANIVKLAKVNGFGQVLDSGLIECKPHGPAPAHVTVTRPRNGSLYRALRTLTGSSQNARRLSFSLIRRTGKKCDVWNGSRLVRASCTSRKSTPFASAVRWTAKLPGTLPVGAYRLTVTARAIDGTLARRVSRFQVGRNRQRR